MGRLEPVTVRVIRSPLLTSRRHIDLQRVCSAISPQG
ncbi:putative leader peptide [Streptomyces sp. TLI_185]|nr:putative leader peptide [Streptomyces sp. TLI_185]